jgi:hypothetical protein
MGSVRLYGATSGYVELQAPDVAPDAALVLPSTGFGKILQVVRATDGTQRTTTSTSNVDASISVTITPQKSDSAIIVIWSGIVQTPTGSQYTRLSVTDASNNRLSGAESALIYDQNTQSLRTSFVLMGYSTPATTSATTYKGRFSSSSGTTTLVNNNSTGQLYAIEVAA